MMMVDFPDGCMALMDGTVISMSHEVCDRHIGKRIFLAGPTKRGGTFEDSWRRDACLYLSRNGFDGIVHVPENMNDMFEDVYAIKQAMWEWERLDAADMILFWVPRKFPENPAMTTNVEFGTFTAAYPSKCLYGRPDDADKVQYLDIMWDYRVRNGEPVYGDLHVMLDRCLEKFGISKPRGIKA